MQVHGMLHLSTNVPRHSHWPYNTNHTSLAMGPKSEKSLGRITMEDSRL